MISASPRHAGTYCAFTSSNRLIRAAQASRLRWALAAFVLTLLSSEGLLAQSIDAVRPNTIRSRAAVEIDITGSGFGTGRGFRVAIGRDSAPLTNVVVTSPTQARGTTPSLDAGVYDLELFDARANRVLATLPDALTVLDLPTITSVEPLQIPIAGGVGVTIRGQSFHPPITVRFGTTAMASPVVSADRTTITGQAPPNAAGTYDVLVVNAVGQTVRRDAVTYVAPQVEITNVTPRNVSTEGGTALTITGRGFAAGDGVRIGTSSLTISSLTSTRIEGTTPALPQGVHVVLINRAGAIVARDSDGVTAGPPPRLSSITPDEIIAGTTPRVLIRGAGLFAGTTATIGGAPLTGITTSPSGVSIEGTAPNLSPGTYDVVASNAFGTDTLEDAVEYIGDSEVTIRGISPRLVSSEGGTAINVAGTGFLAGDILRVGTINLPGTQLLRDMLTATVPAIAPGFYPVHVIRRGEIAATDPEGIEAAPPPEVVLVDPVEVCSEGGTVVRLLGKNLRLETMIQLGPVLIDGLFGEGGVDGSTICAEIPEVPPGSYSVRIVDPRASFMTGLTMSSVDSCTTMPGPQQIETSLAEGTARFTWHNPIAYESIVLEDMSGNTVAVLPGDATGYEVESDGPLSLAIRGEVKESSGATKLTAAIFGIAKFFDCGRPPPLNFAGAAGELDLTLRGNFPPRTVSRCGFDPDPIAGDNDPPSTYSGLTYVQAQGSIGLATPNYAQFLGDVSTGGMTYPQGKDRLTTGFVLEEDATVLEISAYYEKLATDPGVELRCRIRRVYPEDDLRFTDEFTFPDILIGKGKEWHFTNYFRADRDLIDPNAQRCPDPQGPNGFKAIPAGEYLLDFYVVGGDPNVPYFVLADDAYDNELLIPGVPCPPYPLVTVRDLTGRQTLPVITEVLVKVIHEAVLEPDHPHQRPWVRFQAIGTWLDADGNLHQVGIEPDNPDFEYIWTVYDRMGENGRTQSSGSSSRHEMEVEDYGCFYVDLEVRDRSCPLSSKRSYQVAIIRCPINTCGNPGPYQFVYPQPEPGGLWAIAGLNPPPGTGVFHGERPVEFRVVVAPTCSCGIEPCNALTYKNCPAAQVDDVEFRLAARTYPGGQFNTLALPHPNFIQVTDECLDIEFGPKYFHVFIDDLGKIPFIPFPSGGDRHFFREVKLQAKAKGAPDTDYRDIGQAFQMGNYPKALDTGFWTGNFEQSGFAPADQTYHFVVQSNQKTTTKVDAGKSKEIDLLGVTEVPSYDNNLDSGFISRFKMSKGLYESEEGQGTSSGQVMGNGMNGAPVRVGGTNKTSAQALAFGDGGGHIVGPEDLPRYEWCNHQEIFNNEFSQKLFEAILYTGTIGPVPVTIWASIGIGFAINIESQVTVFVSPFAPLQGGPFIESHFYLLSDLTLRIPCEVRADILGGIGSVAVRLIPEAKFFFDTHVFTYDVSPGVGFFYDCLFNLYMEVEGCINLLLAELCVGVTIPIVEDAHLIGPQGDNPRPPITCDDGGGNELVLGARGPDGGGHNHDHSLSYSFYMTTSAPETVTSPDGKTTIDMWLDEFGRGNYYVNESDPREFPEFFLGSEFRGQYRDPRAAFLSNTSALLVWTESFAQDTDFTVQELHAAETLPIASQNLITRQDEIVMSALVYEEVIQGIFEWVPKEVFRIADDPNDEPNPALRFPDGRASVDGDLADQSAWIAWVRYDDDFLVLDGTKTVRELCTPQDICPCPPQPGVQNPKCFKTVTYPNWRPQLEKTGIWVRRCDVQGPLGSKIKISNPGINIEPVVSVAPSGDVAYVVWVHDANHTNLVDSNIGRELVFSKYDKATDTWSPQAQVVIDPDRFPGILEPTIALKDDQNGIVAFSALDPGAPVRDTGLGGGNRAIFVSHLVNGVFGEPIRIHGKCQKRVYGHWAEIVVDVPAEINWTDLHHGPHPEWVMIFEGKGIPGTREGAGDVMVTVLGQGMSEWTDPVSLTPDDHVVSNIAGSLRDGLLSTIHLDKGTSLIADGVAQGLAVPEFKKTERFLEPDLVIASCRLSDGFPAPGSIITATIDVENRGLAGSAITTATGQSACGVEIVYVKPSGEERVAAAEMLPVIQPAGTHRLEIAIEMPHDPVKLIARLTPNPVDRDRSNDSRECFFGAPPVEELLCSVAIPLSDAAPLVARLGWTNPAIYEEIMIYKNGSMLTSLPGASTSYIDLYVEEGRTYFYEVRARIGVSKSVRVGCELAIRPPVPPQEIFLRTDTNGDGRVDISDAIATLQYLFLGGDEPPCIDAADANDSGMVDISDPTYALNFLFLGGPEPPPPHEECGVDPTEDRLTCVTPHACN